MHRDNLTGSWGLEVLFLSTPKAKMMLKNVRR